MALPAPSVVSYERKQLFIAIWQVFPIWIALLQQIIPYLRRCFMKTFIIENEVYKRRTIGTMRTAYMTMLTVATVTRVSAWTVPISSFLFPSIFAPDAVNSLTPSSVFKPAAVTASVKMPSLAASSILFLQHDEIVGSAAVVIWSLALYLNTTGKKTMGDWISLMVKGTGIAAVAGPQGFAVAAIWARDEIIFAIDQTEKKKR
ncbi:MAG: hypothetical protein L6R41_003823 [Letrouitia leprolyta]|nr:MAG: hypothetical protein L6R41_003823 [Letrouitia leprolyta]